MWRALLSIAVLSLAGCNAPVASAPFPSGELIAFGGGPGGPADACFSCHGLKGEGDGAVPRLAGLSSSYLVKQLVDYDGPWRHEKVMSPIAARLSDADRLAVSRYYEGVDIVRAPAAGSPDGAALYASGDPERGVRPCADCHGEYAEGIGLASPRLAGQTQTYLRKQLIAWKESTRRNDPRDQMGAIARRLTEIEIDALARYLAGLQ